MIKIDSLVDTADAFPEDASVTVMIAQYVKPGCEAAFEEWTHGVTEVAMAFDGHLGTNILRPEIPGSAYRVIFSFQTRGQLRAWEESEERAAWLVKSQPLRSAPAEITATRGLAYWVPSPQSPRGPGHLKRMVATFMGLWPSVVGVSWAIGPVLDGLPGWADLGLQLMCTIVVMEFVAMPLVSRGLGSWLYPKVTSN